MLRCFTVSVGAIHRDYAVSVLGFEGQSKLVVGVMRRMVTVVAMVVPCGVDTVHVLTKN